MLDIELLPILGIIVATVIGAIIQEVTGFGFGVFVMTLFPYFMPNYIAAVTLSSTLSFTVQALNSYKRRKDINFKLILIPLVGYIIACSISVTLSLSQSEGMLKAMLGVVLIILSIYFTFFSGKVKLKPTPVNGFVAGATSGVLGGLFSTGGPPMVLYFMSTTASMLEYLASIQFFFTLGNAYNIMMRIINGIYTPYIVFMWALALVSLTIGSKIGSKIIDRINDALLRKLVYGFMGISGVLMLITSL